MITLWDARAMGFLDDTKKLFTDKFLISRISKYLVNELMCEISLLRLIK